jgi:transposase
MSGKRYTDEFKLEAVRQCVDQGHAPRDVAKRLGINSHSLYTWIKRYKKPPAVQRGEAGDEAELRRLRAELKRVTEERDILKKAAAYFAKQSG